MEPALSAGMDHAVEKIGDKAKAAVEKMAATVFTAALLRTVRIKFLTVNDISLYKHMSGQLCKPIVARG